MRCLPFNGKLLQPKKGHWPAIQCTSIIPEYNTPWQVARWGPYGQATRKQCKPLQCCRPLHTACQSACSTGTRPLWGFAPPQGRPPTGSLSWSLTSQKPLRSQHLIPHVPEAASHWQGNRRSPKRSLLFALSCGACDLKQYRAVEPHWQPADCPTPAPSHSHTHTHQHTPSTAKGCCLSGPCPCPPLPSSVQPRGAHSRREGWPAAPGVCPAPG